jgi:formylglycine-generating enzyme required for sulfatase activity
MARPGAPEPSSVRRNAALALLPDDPSRAGYLVDRLLREDVRPGEIAVIRQALARQGQANLLTRRLWTLVAERHGSEVPNLGAAGALALFAPGDSRWVELGPPITAELVSRGPLLIGDWRQVFQPVQRHLIGPLRAIFADFSRPRERTVSGSVLLDFALQPGNSARDEDLAELIPDADPEEFRTILRGVGNRRRAATVLLSKLVGPPASDEQSARRRGRVAAALITLGAPDSAWPLLRRSGDDDPGARTELIHDLRAYGVPWDIVAARLLVETDASARRALILALGEYPPTAVAAESRRPVQESLRDLYVSDGDPGVHSAIAWLFRRRWDLGRALDAIEESVPRHGVSDRRRWFINKLGETMAVIPIAEPVEFVMGSPEEEGGRDSDERFHRARLDRSFAIATREVTAAQFERYRSSDHGASKAGDEIRPASSCPDCPVVGVDWLAVAAFCNWLSRLEGLRPYYDIGSKALSAPDPAGIGYRLPSEREWEFACRAGARTSRPHGASEAMLGHFAWFLPNASMRVQPVGQLKPNDFGLFDILGNAFEWTEDRYFLHGAASIPPPLAGAENPATGRDEMEVVLRGGCFSSPAALLRSAYRERSVPASPLATYGFRYVRTLPTVPLGEDRNR